MVIVKSLKIPNIKVVERASALNGDEMELGQTILWQWHICRKLIDKNAKPIVLESEIMIERAHTLRGLYYTIPPKKNSMYITAIRGSAYINAVDLRDSSGTYKMADGCEISAQNQSQIYIPEDFAWGILSLEDNTVLRCMSTNYISAKFTKVLNYADPHLSISWPEEPLFVSQKNRMAPGINELETQIQLELIHEAELNEQLEENAFEEVSVKHEEKKF